MNFLEAFRDPRMAGMLRDEIHELAGRRGKRDRPLSIMEVCGTHTMAISRNGIRSMLPSTIRLISGPGCPVCVTPPGYIDAAIRLADSGTHLVTFGDLLTVPGSHSTLAEARSRGAAIHVVYSPTAAFAIAQERSGTQVVFLGIGFETTTAPIAAMMDRAHQIGIHNLSILTAFKCVPPALHILAIDPELHLDAFLCPAHVSAIIGAEAYEPVCRAHAIPCVIAGFEPLDILYGIRGILQQVLHREARVDNQYNRVVKPSGNRKALDLLARCFQPSDADWRGIGVLPASGLTFRENWSTFDAERRFDLRVEKGTVNPACQCGNVLKGKILPTACPLFGTACTPSRPIGPCMVSNEGTCSAYFRYEGKGVPS